MAYRSRGSNARGDRTRTADYQVSREYLERAVASDPGDAASWNALGEMYYRLRRFGDAEAAFQEAVRLDGSVETYRGNLAAVGERLGDGPR
ncbi:MAG: tetratricopeptide repeat protein [Armatimonadia bacterium]|nr:tetratricopeptide repeat protein [Armatimonadia bacterium]